MPKITLHLAAGNELNDVDGHLVLNTPRGPVRFNDLSETQALALSFMQNGTTERELLDAMPDAEEQIWVRMMVNRLIGLGVLVRNVAELVRIEVIGDGYRSNSRLLLDNQEFQLCKFSYLHRDDGSLVLESPRSLVRIVILDAAAVMPVIGGIGGPATLAQMQSINEWSEPLTQVLFQEGFLEPVALRHADDPEAVALQEWSFHDLLFHSRSRQGRHRYPYGASYRFEGVRDPLPAVAEVHQDAITVPLPRPDLEVLRLRDPSFVDVVEQRRSWRSPGPEPLSLAQLSEFLFRAARVRGRRATEHEEISNRPYPGGGADYELEIYLLVNRVTDCERGLYRYDPLGHQLVHVSDWTDLVQAVAVDTCRKAPPGQIPDVQFAITARIMRLTYKYDSIPYSVALKDVGVLLQNFYLCSTAMGLAPCAVGGGNSELFATAAGLSPFVEPQIGEFLLNTQDPNEIADVPITR